MTKELTKFDLFAQHCVDIDALFENPNGKCMTLEVFMSNLKEQSKEQLDYLDTKSYVQAGFVALVDAVIMFLGRKKEIQIKDYKPFNSKGELPYLGVDGSGLNANAETVTVHANWKPLMDHLLSFGSHSRGQFKTRSQILFANSDTLPKAFVKEAEHGWGFDPHDIRVIGHKELSKIIGKDNAMFWAEFKEILSNPNWKWDGGCAINGWVEVDQKAKAL